MLKCAFYEREITPPLGCNLPGYFNVRNGSDVKDKLYAKAMVTFDGKNKVAILAVDACSMSYEVRQKVVSRVAKYTDIPAENIICSSNHTHTGVPLRYSSNNEESLDAATGYYDFYERVIADCIILADKRLQDTEISYGMGCVEGISFCRNYYMKNTTPSTNPGRLNPEIEGPVAGIDPDLPILMFKDASGKPIGAIISFACHQDCVDGTEYSGDFSSQLSYEMKKLFGNDFVSLFMLGCCGNINHFNVNTAGDAPDHYRKMGRIIAGEVLKTLQKMEPVKGDTVSAKYEEIMIGRKEADPKKVEEAKHAVATIKEIPGIKIAADGTDPDQYLLAMSKKLLAALEQTEPVICPVQTVKIGDATIYCFPGEIFWQFGKKVKDNAGNDKIIVATQCNAAIGYVPTKDMMYDTIYESRFGSNKLCADAGDIMADKLIQIGK